MRAPDYAEPIVGWRVWRVVPDGESGFALASVLASTRWNAGEAIEARCLQSAPRELLRPWRRRAIHPAPESGCSCGIYAAREIGHAAEYLWRPELLRWDLWPRVIGRVSLWGTVVECANGWRAAAAYPLRLFLPRPTAGRRGMPVEGLADALAAYRVPVEVVERDELPSLLTHEHMR